MTRLDLQNLKYEESYVPVHDHSFEERSLSDDKFHHSVDQTELRSVGGDCDFDGRAVHQGFHLFIFLLRFRWVNRPSIDFVSMIKLGFLLTRALFL